MRTYGSGYYNRYYYGNWRGYGGAGYVYGYAYYVRSPRYVTYGKAPTICFNDEEHVMDNGTTYEALICPGERDSDDKDQCCGDEGAQYCCTGSGGTVLAVLLCLGLLGIIITVVVYCCFCRKKNGRTLATRLSTRQKATNGTGQELQPINNPPATSMAYPPQPGDPNLIGYPPQPSDPNVMAYSPQPVPPMGGAYPQQPMYSEQPPLYPPPQPMYPGDQSAYPPGPPGYSNTPYPTTTGGYPPDPSNVGYNPAGGVAYGAQPGGLPYGAQSAPYPNSGYEASAPLPPSYAAGAAAPTVAPPPYPVA